MTPTKPEALRLADALDARVVTRWVHATGTTPRRSGHSPDQQCRAAADCLRRLHAECESLRTQLQTQALQSLSAMGQDDATIADLRTQLAEAREEAEALRADARRYRFLRNKADPDNGDPYVTIHKANSWGNWFNTHEYCEALDAAVDAMGAKEGE